MASATFKKLCFVSVVALLAFCVSGGFSQGRVSLVAGNQTTTDEKLPNGGGKCINDVDCGGVGHGVCHNGACLCYDAYTNITCEYKRCSQLTAFLLSFFLSSFGVGRFYLGLILSAVFQLLLLICVNVFGCVSKAAEKKPVKVVLALLSLMCSTAIIAWWIADLVLTGTNKILDGEGVHPLNNL